MGYPEITVNGVRIAYEIIGDGPPLVWTPGGFFPRTNECYLVAGRLSKKYRVLIWDRRNCGQSSIGFDFKAPSEFHSYANDLHAVLQELRMTPAILVGGSGGHITSLLTTHLYPNDVDALICYAPPTADREPIERMAQERYADVADIAEADGMRAVSEYSKMAWTFPAMVERDPTNLERLLSIDVSQFAGLMRRWQKWFLSGRLRYAGLTDAELLGVSIPTLVMAPMFDDLHPESSARDVAEAIPNAQYYRDVDRPETETQFLREHTTVTTNAAALLPVWERFLDSLG